MLQRRNVFDITEFFDGPVSATGIFEDRSGAVTRRFIVRMNGAYDADGAFVLSENFAYDDGETQTRSWNIKKGGRDRFLGTAPDIFGTVEMIATPSGVRMEYLHEIKVGGRVVVLRFHDQIHAIDECTAFGRTRVTKLGVTVGQVSIFFMRKSQGDVPRLDAPGADEPQAETSVA